MAYSAEQVDLARRLVDNPLVAAFRETIAWAESGGDYSIYYGGGHFDNNGPHPCRQVTAAGYKSTAAGKYQFLCNTWREIASAIGDDHMTPANQELGATLILVSVGAVDELLWPTSTENKLDGAMRKAWPKWPSLPNGNSGVWHKQQQRTFAQELAYFQNALTALGGSENYGLDTGDGVDTGDGIDTGAGGDSNGGVTSFLPTGDTEGYGKLLAAGAIGLLAVLLILSD